MAWYQNYVAFCGPFSVKLGLHKGANEFSPAFKKQFCVCYLLISHSSKSPKLSIANWMGTQIYRTCKPLTHKAWDCSLSCTLDLHDDWKVWTGFAQYLLTVTPQRYLVCKPRYMENYGCVLTVKKNWSKWSFFKFRNKVDLDGPKHICCAPDLFATRGDPEGFTHERRSYPPGKATLAESLWSLLLRSFG